MQQLGLYDTPELRPCMFEAWPFQRECIDAVFAALRRCPRVLANVFTGGGKTIQAALMCRRGVEAGRKILFLVPTIELAQQTAEKFDLAGMTAMIEQAGQRARKMFEPHVVIGSLMTMKDATRLESFGPDYFDLIVVDEAHISVAESCKRVLAYFRRAKVIGLTATIKRADEQCLGHIYDEVAFRFTLIDAWKAAAPGPYACDIVPVKCDLDIDLRKLKPQKGDFTDRDLDQRIGPMVELMANKIREKIGSRRTLVFLPSIRSSQAMAVALCSLGLAAEAVWGSDPDRAAKVKRYHSGETQVLCNMNLLTTGFDCPATSAIVLARPTRSHTLFLQMIGRGTRVNKEEKECIVLDFGWLTDDFPPVQSGDLLDSPGFDAEAAEIAKGLIAATPGLSLKDAIEQAEVESEERKRRKKEYAVRMAIREREVVCDEETYSMKEAFAEGADATPRTWNMPSPGVKKGSPKQVEMLKGWGYADAENWSIYKVRQTIGARFAQKQAGKSTVSQRDRLARKGVPVQVGREMSKEQADALLDVWEGRRQEVYGGRAR